MQSPLPRTPLMGRSKLRYDAATPKALDIEAARLNDVPAALQEQEERVACVLFALVGIGYLFPFSALTQPVDYWQMLFPDYNIEFAITSAFMYTNLAFLGVIVVFFGKPWYTGRIVGGFTGQLIILAFVPTSYFFLSSENANAIAVLGGTAAVAIATAFIDSSTIALVSQYPLRVQESFQLGVGLSTLIGSFYRDLTKLVFPSDQLVASTLIYFYTGALTIALCIFAYFKVMKLTITQKYVFEKLDAGVELTEKTRLLTSSRVSDDAFGVVTQPTKWTVLKKVIHLQLLITLVFVTSLSLWPPLVTEIKSFNFPSLDASGWWPLILLTIFSIADCAGRFLVRYRCGLTPQNIWIVVVGRIVLIPIFIAIVQRHFFTHDLWSLFFVSVLGYTNGYIGTLTIIFVNESVHPDEQQLAGPFTSFFLNLGLVLGASAGLLVEALVLGK
ncbi:hypothetical protein Poli38472_005811 [Pythium oligandrum]|uniref:Uncharacterized protein n=1 Tax=Pythium oligandrum TaxID=41045 RepID=A0A8K1CSX3_PYTOL|nr:hypothetical protein Poli38472_005811 [Pythium oligandrum]|eukprot:TMW68343.1 hypothetical protein Poli38472_005811 [Pythium oligandrum]